MTVGFHLLADHVGEDERRDDRGIERDDAFPRCFGPGSRLSSGMERVEGIIWKGSPKGQLAGALNQIDLDVRQ